MSASGQCARKLPSLSFSQKLSSCSCSLQEACEVYKILKMSEHKLMIILPE